MKILHIIDSGGFYGAEAMLLDLMTGQKKIGLSPVLCSIGIPGEGPKEIERQAESRQLPFHAVRFRSGLNLSGSRCLLRVAGSVGADILHTHGYKGNILAGLIPRPVRKIPRLATLHGWTNTRRLSKMTAYEWLDRTMLRHADAVVAVNRLMLADARLLSARIPSERLYVVNNGIDSQFPAADPTVLPDKDQIVRFAGDSFVIGSIGRLSEEKGFNHLLEAVAILNRERPLDVKLVLMGDGSLRSDLQQQAVALGIQNLVRFTGYVAGASRFLDCFDVLAISSLSEGLPITLLEAMRAGLPVVSTRVGGIPDVIEDGVSGMLVKSGDARELARAIRQLAENAELGNAISRQALQRFRQAYTSEKMAGDYLEIYKKIVDH